MARPDPRSLLAAVPEAKPAVSVVILVGLATGIMALAQAICLAWAVTSVVTGTSVTAPLLILVVLLVARGALAGVGEYAAR
ncbi:MAG: hypothetical protein WA994_10790, partial [Ornithinimicrobium sp.]